MGGDGGSSGAEYELNAFSGGGTEAKGKFVAPALAPIWQQLFQHAIDDSVDLNPVFHQLLMVHLRVNKLGGASLPLSVEDVTDGEAALMTR